MTTTANADVANRPGRMPPKVEASWADEVDRRRNEVLLGKVKLVPGEKVFHDAMAKYA